MSIRIPVIAVVCMALFSVAAIAADRSLVDTAIPLKDGSTVYIFKDGKMGMEDRYGRPHRMAPGVVMETRDGRQIAMVGDEVAWVQTIKASENRK